MKTQILLEKLVSIPSAFPDEKAIGEYLFTYLQNLGFQVTKIQTEKDRFNIVAVFGRARKYLAFYGHMDTVLPEPDQEDPYRVSIKDNIAIGLGVGDMKGGIAAMLQAGEYAVRNNLPVKLIFGVDEEGISQGAHDLVDSGFLDDVDFLIVGESGQVKNYQQAFSICYGRKGRILFETFIKGKKAHAAESEKAINAIEQAAVVVEILKKISFQEHKNLGMTRVVMHELHSQTDSFSVPDTARILFSLLTTPNIDSKEFLRNIREQASKKRINVALKPFKRKTPYSESYEVDKENHFLKKLEGEIFHKYNVVPIYASSVADENVFANRLKIPVISIGPIGGEEHTRNEWLNLNSLATVEDVYKKIIMLYNKDYVLGG